MIEPIRILQMIGSLDLGGSQTMILNLYKKIDRTKIQFDFIIDHPQGTYLKNIVEKLGAKVYEMPTFTGINYFKVREEWERFFIMHPEYKILHSHVRSYASLYIPIAHKYGVKAIIHSHSTSNGSGITSVVKKIMQYPLRYQADYFMGCSKEAGEWLFGKRIVESERYYVLRNAINTELYRYNNTIRKKYREDLGVGNKMMYIHIGRLHEAKNHIFLLGVFAEIHKRNENTLLYVVGDGELYKSIELRIKELDIRDSVIMLGSRNDVPNLLQAADVFLFPSLWEGLPVTVVEAQAAGLPCYISNTITKEVVLTSLVKELPIDKGTDLWRKEIQNSDLVRRDVIADIKNAGFDVESTANWLSNFYLLILGIN